MIHQVVKLSCDLVEQLGTSKSNQSSEPLFFISNKHTVNMSLNLTIT